MGEMERPSQESLKAEALNHFARALAAATTIEEARGIALLSLRKMLDLIYPSQATDTPPGAPNDRD